MNNKDDWDFSLPSFDNNNSVKESKSSKKLFSSEVIRINDYKVKGFLRIKNIEDLAATPEKGQHIRIVTHNSFNAFDILEYFAMKFEKIDECYITTYSLGENTLRSLIEMKSAGVIDSLNLVVTESIRFRKPTTYARLKTLASDYKGESLRIALVWNHSKIMLLKIKNNFFVIEGSGNFNGNAYIEQYSLDNNEDIYSFHKNWIDSYVFDADNIDKKRHVIL